MKCLLWMLNLVSHSLPVPMYVTLDVCRYPYSVLRTDRPYALVIITSDVIGYNFYHRWCQG